MGPGVPDRMSYFLRLCRLALMRLRYLCLLIFFRRFLTSDPIQTSDRQFGFVDRSRGETIAGRRLP